MLRQPLMAIANRSSHLKLDRDASLIATQR
jgi:hypothetical protein